MYRLKIVDLDALHGIVGVPNLTAAKPLGDFPTLKKAVIKSDSLELDGNRAFVEDLSSGEQFSVNQARHKIMLEESGATD
ncbi:MAG TPA: hypothetical protein VNX18_06735 [Bryobacteraceae bacterium]|jgi:hypothetical protein|nr:hypothetical protein [Bryobacteraceae bacterium]